MIEEPLSVEEAKIIADAGYDPRAILEYLFGADESVEADD